MDRCPKCGSAAWVEGAGCVICGHEAARRRDDGHRAQDPEGWWDGPGGDPGLRRLEAAWAERDRQLDGDGSEGVGPEAKGYTCKACGETFPTCQALAGHANHHRRSSNGPRAARRRPALVEAGDGSGAGGDAARTPPDPICPLCAQDLPAAVGVLAQQFEREGAGEELALKLATLAWAGLRTS